MRIYFLVAILAIVTACNKEAALTPDPVQPMYTLPQGNHSYDDSIVAFHKKYDSYILYKFTQYDYAYNYIDKRTDSAFVADPASIPLALQFLKQHLFSFYPDAFLMKTMPFKILLASSISKNGIPSVPAMAASNSMLAFGYANSTLAQKTPAETKQLRAWLNRAYMERALRVGAINIPPDFMVPIPGYKNLQEYNKYAAGVVEPINEKLNVVTDLLGFIELATGHTYDELTSPGHPLSPNVDVNGQVKRRYSIMISYFQNMYGVDLQAIGNTP